MNEYIDLRGYYPINDNFRLYVDLGLGAGHGVLHMDTKNAQFFCQFFLRTVVREVVAPNPGSTLYL